MNSDVLVILLLLVAVFITWKCSSLFHNSSPSTHSRERRQPGQTKPILTLRQAWIHARSAREQWETFHPVKFDFNDPEYQRRWLIELGAEELIYHLTGRYPRNSSRTAYRELQECVASKS